MDDRYTFKKIEDDDFSGYFIGCLINDRMHYFNWKDNEVYLDEFKESRWDLLPVIENGIVRTHSWNKTFQDIFEKNDIKKLFIGQDDEIIQRFILNPHKLKLGVKEWMLDIPSKK